MTERRTKLSVQTGPFFRYGYAVLMDVAWRFFHPVHKYKDLTDGLRPAVTEFGHATQILAYKALFLIQTEQLNGVFVRQNKETFARFNQQLFRHEAAICFLYGRWIDAQLLGKLAIGWQFMPYTNFPTENAVTEFISQLQIYRSNIVKFPFFKHMSYPLRLETGSRR